MRSPFVNPTKRKINPLIEVAPDRVKAVDDWLSFNRSRVFPIGSSQPAKEFFQILREPHMWLIDYHMDTYLNVLRLRLQTTPEEYRSPRIAFLDTVFITNWHIKYPEFVRDNEFFPSASLDYSNGELPAYAKTRKQWRVDVDDLYGVLHVGCDHWVGFVISIPNRSIEVMDCAPNHVSDTVLADALQPISHMLPHLLRFVAHPDDKMYMSTEAYQVLPRDRTLPRNTGRQGDCGVYALRFIECHAKGLIPVPRCLNDRNMRQIRAKMAAEMFEETFRYGTSTSALEQRNSVSDYGNSIEFLEPQ